MPGGKRHQTAHPAYLPIWPVKHLRVHTTIGTSVASSGKSSCTYTHTHEHTYTRTTRTYGRKLTLLFYAQACFQRQPKDSTHMHTGTHEGTSSLLFSCAGVLQEANERQHTHTYTHTHTETRAHTFTHTHTQFHTHTETRTHTFTHTKHNLACGSICGSIQTTQSSSVSRTDVLPAAMRSSCRCSVARQSQACLV